MRRSILAAALIAPALLAAPAAAQGVVGAVLPFSGPQSSQVRNVVVQAIGDRAELIPERDIRSASRDLRANPGTSSGAAAVSSELGLAFIIRGRVRGSGRRARLELSIVGPNGDVLGEMVIQRLIGGSGRRRIADATQELVVRAIAEYRPPEAEPEPEPDPIGAAWGTDDLDDDDEDDDDDDEPREAGEIPILAAYLGVGWRTRSATIDLVDSGRRLYEAGLFFEITGRVELRPLAGSDSAAKGLYAQLDFGQSLGLSSSDMDGSEVDTTARRFFLSAGYVHTPDGRGWEAGGLLGFGLEAFLLGDNTVMPSSTYPQLRIGLLGRVSLVDDLLWLGAEAGFRIAFGVGDIGTSFGDGASAKGIDFGIFAHGATDIGLGYGVRFAFQRYGLSFSGDATDSPGDGGSDKGIVLSLQAAYEFR